MHSLTKICYQPITLTFHVLESADPPLNGGDWEYFTVHLYRASSFLVIFVLTIVFIFQSPATVVVPLTSFIASLKNHSKVHDLNLIIWFR